MSTGVRAEVPTAAAVDEGVARARMARFTNPMQARGLAEAALESARAISYEAGVARSQFLLGVLDSDEGAYKSGIIKLDEAWKQFARLEDMSSVCDTLCALANIKHRQHDYSEALRLVHESQTLAVQLEKPLREADIYALQGAIAHTLGDNQIAEEHLEKSEELFHAHQSEPDICLVGLGRVYSLRGLVYQASGRLEIALDCLHAALAEFQRNAGHSGVASALINLGVYHGRQENYDKAEEYFERAMAQLTHVNHRIQMAAININMAALNMARERLDRAGVLYAESLRMSRAVEFQTGIINSLMGLGQLHFKQERFAAAETHLLEAEEVAAKIQSKPLLAEIYVRLANLYEADGSLKPALEYLKKVRAIETELFNTESDVRLKRYRILRDNEAAQSEQEIHRLRNVELASANRRLEELIRTKNSFMGIAAHDLKNPIASIKAMAQLLLFQDEEISREEVHEYCRDILANSDRMLRLVNNLLDLNNIERGHLKVRSADYDLAEQVKQFAALSQHMANNKNISVNVNVPDTPVFIFADRDITVQILDNLLSNALKFSDPGSHVEICVSQHSGRGRFAVIDNGPGISPKEIPKLFSSFTRLSAQPTGGESSTGLGLAIVKQLVDAMDGRIWCESEWGQGASFIVDLPSARESH